MHHRRAPSEAVRRPIGVATGARCRRR